MKHELTPNVKVGDVLKLTVNKIGNNGDPMMLHDGFVIFLKEAEKKGFDVGVQMDVKIIKVLDKFAFAERV